MSCMLESLNEDIWECFIRSTASHKQGNSRILGRIGCAQRYLERNWVMGGVSNVYMSTWKIQLYKEIQGYARLLKYNAWSGHHQPATLEGYLHLVQGRRFYPGFLHRQISDLTRWNEHFKVVNQLVFSRVVSDHKPINLGSSEFDHNPPYLQLGVFTVWLKTKPNWLKKPTFG